MGTEQKIELLPDEKIKLLKEKTNINASSQEESVMSVPYGSME